MTETCHLYLTGTQVSARRTSGWPGARIEPLDSWDWDASMPSSLSFEPAALPQGRRANLRVYAGAALCKFTTMAMPAGLRGAVEQRAAAQAHLHQQLGLNSADWSCTLAPSAVPGTTVICALRRSVVERLHDLADANRLRLVSLHPYVASVWNAFQRRQKTPSALMAIEPDAFTLIVARAGVIASISALCHRGENDLLEREIRRLSFSFDGNMHEHLRIALPDSLLPMAHAHRDKIVPRAGYLSKALYADFRDLLFSGEAQ